MSNLPALTFKDQVYSLPNHGELIDVDKPFDSKKHKFRPSKQILKQMHDYAFAVVDQVDLSLEKLIKLFFDAGFSN